MRAYVDMQGTKIEPGDVVQIGIEDDDMNTDWYKFPIKYCAEHDRLEAPWGKDQHYDLDNHALDGEVQGVICV